MYGVILIHNWSRSLIDCLLKSSFSQIRNEKTIDQEEIQINLRKGILNSRAKYLAFLDIQTRYIMGFEDKYINDFDKKKELELILEKYTESDLKIFKDLYEEQKINLLKKKNYLDNYPPYKNGLMKQIEELNKKDYYQN